MRRSVIPLDLDETVGGRQIVAAIAGSRTFLFCIGLRCFHLDVLQLPATFQSPENCARQFTGIDFRHDHHGRTSGEVTK
jgi:hypothetical protein